MHPVKYLRSVDVERIYGIKSTTLNLWRQKGIGPRYSKVCKLIRYSVEEMDKYMESCRQKTATMDRGDFLR